MTHFLKRKFLSDNRALFLDLKSIWILLIASFLIEINAKYSQKAGDKNCQSPNLGCVIDGAFSYINAHDVMPHWTLFIYLFALLSHAFKIDPIKLQIYQKWSTK